MKVAAVRLIAKTLRAPLASRVLGAGVLAAVLPTLLLTPLHAEVILLHSDCDGGTHAHRFDAANLQDWQAQHARENACCGPEEASSGAVTGETSPSNCDHNQPPIIIAKGPLVVTRAGHAPTVHLSTSLHAAGPAVVPWALLIGCGTHVASFGAAGPPRAPGDGTETVLSRNHALLL